MSLTGQALVIIVSKALAERTWAESRVLMQPVDPIVAVLKSDASAGNPHIAVYAEKVEADGLALETQRGCQEVTCKIIAYFPPAVTIIDGEAELDFSGDSAGLGLSLMGRQVDAALHYGNQDWVDLFRKFALKMKDRKARYILVELENGVRIPCLELEYCFDTLPEPEFGRPIYGHWLELDTKLRETSQGAQLANLFKALIEEPTDLPDWAQFQMATNLTDAAFATTGLNPLATDDDNEEVPLVDIISEPDVTVVPPVLD